MADVKFGDYITQFEKDSSEPVECTLSGSFPKWLNGSLYRNGPGRYVFGPDTAKHLFDGLATIHKYTFTNGRMTYQNRLLPSKALTANTAANRLVQSDFGTTAVPDPCKTIFHRYFSYYFGSSVTDNAAVNVFTSGDALFAISDTNILMQISKDNLDIIKDRRSDYERFSLHLATAHPHQDRDGTVYNQGTCFGAKAHHALFKIPPPDKGHPDPLQKLSLVAQIIPRWRLNMTYTHSFAMSENYLIWIEHPTCFNIAKLALKKVTGSTTMDSITFHGKETTILHVVEKSSGKKLSTVYQTQALFMFHQVNAYEENNQIIIDIIGHEDSRILQHLYLKNLQDGVPNDVWSPGQFWRFIIPLDVTQVKPEENLVTLPNTTATARLLQDGSVWCTPEKVKDAYFELPRINYDVYNMKKYRYAYGVQISDSWSTSKIVKLDIDTKKLSEWKEEDTSMILGEPVFVATPGGTREDDGVLLVPSMSVNVTKPCGLNILDAATLTLIAKATFPVGIKAPNTFHGLFLNHPAPE
jgi:carotenoid cleavage dioxygenase-like enzyme